MKKISNDATLPCTLVIFGATGDLTKRKLLPALYRLKFLKMLPDNFNIVGFSTRDLDSSGYRDYAKEAILKYSKYKPIDENILNSLISNIHFISSSFENKQGFNTLLKKLNEIDESTNETCGKLYYTATPPSFYTRIIEMLKDVGLNKIKTAEPYLPRVVLEKPFGKDARSAKNLNDVVFSLFQEEQVYLIDHYLGKETVQNLLFFRFANGIYEPIWNRRYIDNVQITVAEPIGVEDRGKYFEEAGILRDMIQNHILQLLSLFAMEPPVNMEPDVIRGKKIELLKAIRPIPPHEIHKYVVRGQYGESEYRGEKIKGYRQEMNVSPDSTTETFVALKILIDNWRWSEVPFYIRTGKRLKKHVTEIAIHFKQVPHCLFNTINCGSPESNILTLKIQPDEGINFQFNVKRPGSTNFIETVNMDFSYQGTFKTELPEAYERLIYDFIIGDSTLFPHSKGVETAWNFITAILEGWENQPPPRFPNYEAGSFGPEESLELLARDGRVWKNP